MIEDIEVTVDNKKYTIQKGALLEELAVQFQHNYKYPIILAKVDNRFKELSMPIEESSTIEFMDLTTKEGNRTYICGLTYLLICAFKEHNKRYNIQVAHSIDKGIYFTTDFKLTEEMLKEIKKTMKTMIDADVPITRVTVDRMEAVKYFESVNNDSKVGIMHYNTDNYVTLYRLGKYYNYFFHQMPTSTKQLSSFDLTYISEKGFILRFPTIYSGAKIPPYKHHPHMFEAFDECREWAKTIHVTNSVKLNKVVSLGRINDLIRVDETLQSNRLLQVARNISDKRKKIKIVLLAGPSSSGKTTTSIKLCTYLESFGLRPVVLSMDDYFKDLKDTPKDEKGNYDFECLEAVDLNLFDKQISSLLKKEKVVLPKYDFTLGKKAFRDEIQLTDDHIIVIEGIHALDNKVLTNIERDKKYKIYLSALTELNIDDYNRVSTTDNRLLRRIIRDNRTRDYKVEETLASWASVRQGEEKHIFPYQDDADYTFNTALIYEIGVLKTYVEPLLYSVPHDSPYYEEAKRLIRFLKLFLPIPSEAVPQDSILREFIGGSCFHA